MPDGSNTPEEAFGKNQRQTKLATLKAAAVSRLKNLFPRGATDSSPASASSATRPTVPALSPPPDELHLPPEFYPPLSEQVDTPPLPSELPQDPHAVLAYLRAHNPQYEYEKEFTPEEIAKAVAFAKEHDLNPEELSPAQITLAQHFQSGEQTPAEIAEKNVEERMKRLTQRQAELLPIILPQHDIFIHATPSLDNVKSIVASGLYCHAELGLGGVAVPLDKTERTEELITKQVMLNNISNLAHTHRGYRYVVILDLPSLTDEQRKDYTTRKASGENASFTSYFVQPLDKPVGAQGVGITYDALLPPQYIRGYLDLDTAQFHPKSQLVTQ